MVIFNMLYKMVIKLKKYTKGSLSNNLLIKNYGKTGKKSVVLMKQQPHLFSKFRNNFMHCYF